ncbi:MAG: hypothetical protein JST84_17420 [Acidobacteria bacterium]|nr:hypothetical protein [Acidobacteriota bacterium]
MNCLDFDKIVMDVARSETQGVLMDAIAKQQALAHAQNCTRCANCLASEKALTQGLRAVVLDDRQLGAPVVIENALLAAFRRQADEKAVPVVVAPVESPFKLFFSWMRWGLIAAAAVALIVFAVARVTQPQPASLLAAGNSATPTPSTSVNVKEPEPNPVPQVKADPALEMASTAPPNRLAVPIKAAPVRRAAQLPRGNVTVDVGPFELDEPERLSPNDFLVFDYARNLPPADSTELMRVRLPRSRLAPLGIPLPREVRNSDFVNADFLVGSDGVPRAIRVLDR